MEQRAKFGLGYRVHSSMFRMRWKAEPVRVAIRALPDRDQRAKAKAARKFLRANADSAYAEFATEHEQFLEENPDADQTVRRRRLAFLERPGVECALWPALFWNKSMTFSQERASDPRRQKAETLEQALRPARPDSEDEAAEEEEDAPDDDLVRHSVKRLYNALALSSLLGYTEHFEILQFVYDLHLWSDLGAKRSLGTGVPMRLMMAGSSFSPIYWKRAHNGLTDLVRQVGFPKFFFTLAPSEWTLPYHGFVLDSMSKLLRGRLRLPVEETLHIVHVLLQTAKGFLLGDTGSREAWKDHVRGTRRAKIESSTALSASSFRMEPAGLRRRTTTGPEDLICISWCLAMRILSADWTSQALPAHPCRRTRTWLATSAARSWIKSGTAAAGFSSRRRATSRRPELGA